MKDSKLRGLILQKYYDRRREGYFQWADADFADLPDFIDFDAVDLYRACDQLADCGLIDWKPLHDHQGRTIGGAGRINANGVNVIKNNVQPPISIVLDQSHKVTANKSSNVQIGNSNLQDVSIELRKLISAINHSKASDAEKNEAKSLLKKFIEHPLVTSITGGLASSIKFDQ